MSTMAAAVTGSKIQTAHDDTREFIRGLEMTARKVHRVTLVSWS